MTWHVYIIECADHTLYIGITSDLDRRIATHNAGTSGAKYVRSRRPVTLRYAHPFADQGLALKEEFRIKQLSRVAKLALVQNSDELSLPPKSGPVE